MKHRNNLIWRVIALVSCLILLNVPAFAQGGVLTYGGGTSGSFSATAPLGFYSFSGTADDVVTIQILALTPGLQPTVALNAPNQQQLAFNGGDPFNPGTARITYQLTQTGLYTILVSGNGGTGDYALRLDGSAAPQTVEVSDDAPADSTLDAAVPAQVYTVQANPDAPTTVTISSNSAGFGFTAAVRNASGQTIAILTGSDTQPILATLPQGNGTYDIEVRPLVAGTQGNIQVSIGLLTAPDAPSATATPDAPPPVTTEEATVPPPATTEDADTTCRAVNSGNNGINIRSGPGTDYNVVDNFLPNTERAVLGVNGASGWYVIALANGGQGWVFGTLVNLVGDCSVLNEIAAPDDGQQQQQQQQGQATATYTPSYTPAQQQQNPPTATQAQQQQGQATPTFTPSYTVAPPTLQPTATFTPSYTPTIPVQVAPEDARFNNPLNIPLDSTASVLDFVSYPNGDTEDRVRWDITGMNSNSSLTGGRARLVISVSCFGQNTDHVQFFTGGNTYSCGQTIVDQEVTFNSKTGSVVITAVGGEGTYVQWVLTGTATRTN